MWRSVLGTGSAAFCWMIFLVMTMSWCPAWKDWLNMRTTKVRCNKAPLSWCCSNATCQFIWISCFPVQANMQEVAKKILNAVCPRLFNIHTVIRQIAFYLEVVGWRAIIIIIMPCRFKPETIGRLHALQQKCMYGFCCNFSSCSEATGMRHFLYGALQLPPHLRATVRVWQNDVACDEGCTSIPYFVLQISQYNQCFPVQENTQATAWLLWLKLSGVDDL